LLEDLESHPGFEVEVINTSRGLRPSQPLRNFFVALRSMIATMTRLRKADVVSYHASDRGMFLFAPWIVAVARVARKPVVLRIFGGSFGDFYASRGALARAIIRRCILSADVILVQTLRAIAQLQPVARGKLVWFSTYIRRCERAAEVAVTMAASRCTNFVFLGHLWRTKGLEVMLDAATRLPGDATLDIYGPLDEYTAEEVNTRGAGRVRYQGFLSHAQVDERLWQYDCLVLPTFHPGEGYPGVIAEAFAHELPVIATRWLAIPEIVDERCGILIEPGSVAELLAAMDALHRDSTLWRKLKEGARARASEFDHGVWARRFEEICEGLVA
jgi:glycosyltransferase involved in cell wall biosynthesis